MENLIFQLGVFVVLFVVGWGFGRYFERKHLKELEQNERLLSHIKIDTNRFVQPVQPGQLPIFKISLVADSPAMKPW